MNLTATGLKLIQASMRGNLLLVDEADQVYTCFYIKEKEAGILPVPKGLRFQSSRWKNISILSYISRMSRYRNFYMTATAETASRSRDMWKGSESRFWICR